MEIQSSLVDLAIKELDKRPFNSMEEYSKQRDKILRTLSEDAKVDYDQLDKAVRQRLRISLPPRPPSTAKPTSAVAVPKGATQDVIDKLMREGMDEFKESPKATVDAEGRLKLPPRVPSTPKPPVSVEAVPKNTPSKFAEELPRAKAMADEFRKIGMSAAQKAAPQADRATKDAFDRIKMLYDLDAQNQGKNIAQMVQNSERMGKVSKAAKGLSGAAAPAAGLISAATDFVPKTIEYAKQNPEASNMEVMTSPEVTESLAGLVGSQLGAGVGARVGAMAPGYLKLATVPAGAVAGAYGGAELAKLLTGIPAVDKVIREMHQKAKMTREGEVSQADRATKVAEELSLKGPKDDEERLKDLYRRTPPNLR